MNNNTSSVLFFFVLFTFPITSKCCFLYRYSISSLKAAAIAWAICLMSPLEVLTIKS